MNWTMKDYRQIIGINLFYYKYYSDNSPSLPPNSLHSLSLCYTDLHHEALTQSATAAQCMWRVYGWLIQIERASLFVWWAFKCTYYLCIPLSCSSVRAILSLFYLFNIYILKNYADDVNVIGDDNRKKCRCVIKCL